MPTVPTYQRQVAPTRAPNVQVQPVDLSVSAEQLDAGRSEAIGQLAGQAFEIAREEQKKANQMRLLEADTRLGQFETNRLYDPESGALNQRGKDAFDLPNTVMEEYDQLAAEIEKGLSTDEQRMAFRRVSASRRQSIDLALQRHVSGEVKRYDDQQVESALEVSRSNAVANYRDPSRVKLEIARSQAIIADHADRNGLPNEFVQAEHQKIASGTHLAVMDRMVEDDPVAAREYYQAVKDQLTGDDQARADAVIDQKAKAYEADAMAQQIADAGGDQLSEWLGEANDIEDPEMRRMVKAGLQERWRTVEVQRDEMVQNAYQLIEQGGKPSEIPISQWLNLPASVRSNLETRYRQVQQGIEPVQNDRAWLEFSALDVKGMASMSQGELYNQYRSNLDDAHWNRAVAMWSDARAVAAGGASEDVTKRLSNTLTFKDRTQSAAVESGIIPADKTPSQYSEDQVVRLARFEEQAARLIEDAEIAKGRKLTGNETQDVLDEMVMNTVFIDRTLRTDPELPVAALLDDEMGQAYVPIEEIPNDAAARMMSYAESQGWRLPTDTKDRNKLLERAYAAALRGDNALVAEILRGQ